MDLVLNEEKHHTLELWQAILILIPLCSLALWIIVSNTFVTLAVFCFSSMRSPTNIYLASLASTDLLVGLIILPFNIIQIVYNEWIFSQEMCKTWLTLDVTLSTLSILHLIAIAVDRFRAVSDGIMYLQNRSVNDVIQVILCLWCISVWIATPPVLGWGNWIKIEVDEIYMCDYSSTVGYVVHSAFGSFIFPMILMVNVYMKIYRKIQQRLKERASVPSLDVSLDRELSETETSGSLYKNQVESLEKARVKLKILRPSSQIHDFVSKKIRFSLTKERRAARTLGIIIGAFLICWLPFCTMYILRPFTGEPPVVIYHLLTWLGYCNSACNPVVYCIYNKDFKQVFNRIFCRRKNRVPRIV